MKEFGMVGIFVMAMGAICLHESKFHDAPLWRAVALFILALFTFYLDSKDVQQLNNTGG